MDKATLRRGMETVHTKYGSNTALLTGDVMMIQAYEYLNKIKSPHLHHILQLFNKTAREVCEGQQLRFFVGRRDYPIVCGTTRCPPGGEGDAI